MKYYFEILKKFNDFHGKASREEFKHFALIHTAIVCVLVFMGYATDHALAVKVMDTITGLFVVSSVLSCAALIVRRLNALGRNPRLVFAALIPLLGLLYLVVICLKDETRKKSDGPLGKVKGLFQKFPRRQQVL